MSNQEENQQLLVTPEDCEAAFAFFSHFDIPKIPELDEALTAFKANPTPETQKKIIHAVCKAVGFTKHEVFEDEMFERIVKECRSVAYDLEFDKELEEKLTEDQ